MSPILSFRVFGDPAPQGSKRGGVSSKTGKTFVYEQNSKTQTQWRQDVIAAAQVAREVQNWMTASGCTRVAIKFLLPRPASVKVSKRPYPGVKPDIDKLLRNTLDGLKQAGVYTDDATVIDVQVAKRYATADPDGAPGAFIRVDLVPEPVII